MRKTFWQYYWDSLHNFGEGIINIFIFLPYFFSVSALLKTLFYPWKNLIIKKTFVGFSLADWANRFAFNLISSSMGVVMRISIISFYFILQTIFMFVLPFVALSFFLFTPFFYLISLTQKTSQEKKDIFKKKFIETHLLIEENRFFVENWFEKYYRQNLEKIQWWKLSNLFTYPPLARDWAVGYTPILDQYATDLATSSYLHHIKNIIDREKEITEVEQILTKSNESNVIIVGEEGVGKHTIIDALAKKIYLGKTNIHLMYRRILKLNMERILKEKNFEDLLEEAQQAKNIILFIDNFDKYINLSISLEKYAKSNLIQIIGTTTPFDYQSFIFPNEKINQMFSKVDVYEVTDEEAENILLESVFTFENHNKVSIFYETVKEVIEKSKFYLTYIPFPEKAVDLLDQACVYAVSNSPKTKDTPKVTPDTINQVLTEKIHIPITITKQMKEKLLNLELILSSRIIQQDEAIKKLSSALRRSFLLIGKRKKPLASFLFLGPTGVGKTETAKVVSNVFFEDLLLRFDMSEFQSKYDIPKLIGDSTNPGLLTQTIREQSYGVLLLDEIEKADKDLINIFLTIVDEGYFIDGKGKRVDCKNLVIIATSNAQNENTFSPEFLNRYDGIITFEFLNKESIRILAKKMIEKISLDIFKIYKVRIFVSEKTINFVSKKGFDSRFGARNLERTIRDEIEDKVSKLIFQDKAKPGETINL
ncbi:MAG: Endopeptidase clp ATP-binding chain a [Candidatus Roizmanbacteria bacterium GW2011_GWC2_34_23]|uniref:Endopeptidase clp ATP-binding chain a n=1 Tax=Candidatus Roizmanbacteria bacterium GW2011_GWC2_34_23 TaxID=1618484 RepID=A0A0G0AWF7_9BACT|nr:MAG: Endopeptidase clp ATP-binding chain a [Candidatus Roizmanbacteria bacterium GW2011_GWC2_34_23]